MEHVQRFTKPIKPEHLQQVLTGSVLPVEPIGTEMSLGDVWAAVESIDLDVGQTKLDQALLEPLHRALPLTPREASDMRVWHWLCATQFSELVWRRWSSGVPAADELSGALTPAMERRFLGSTSLVGVSRNTLARLWWTAERMREGEDYEPARVALENQDMFQNIFERFFGSYPPAARACLENFRGRKEPDIRRASRWLQQVLSTTTLEYLSQDQVAGILKEVLP